MQTFKKVDNLTGRAIKAGDLAKIKGARSVVVFCGIQLSPCSAGALNGKAPLANRQGVPYARALEPHAFDARFVALL